MARNWMDERREKREVVARLAGLFREIDEFMTAVKSPAAQRRLPLATRLQLHAKALDRRLKAVRMMIEVDEGPLGHLLQTVNYPVLSPDEAKELRAKIERESLGLDEPHTPGRAGGAESDAR